MHYNFARAHQSLGKNTTPRHSHRYQRSRLDLRGDRGAAGLGTLRSAQQFRRQSVPRSNHLYSDQLSVCVEIKDDHALRVRTLDGTLDRRPSRLNVAEVDVGSVSLRVERNAEFGHGAILPAGCEGG